jgi:small multidrug resistance pump
VSKYHLYLLAAIACEVAATTALARSDGFTRLWPSLIAVAGYALAFWLLSFPLRTMPTGIVYAIWSGMGIVLITAVSWVWYRQSLDAPALIGISLILLGVMIVNLFSSAVTH